MATAGVDIKGIDQALAAIGGLSAASRRAATRAQNKVAKQLGVQGARAIARANQLPVKVIRDRLRVKSARPGKVSDGQTDQGARVWIGTWPIPASKAGRVRMTRAGAAAGKHIYPDYFVATMSSGHRSVFQRVGKGQRWTPGRPRTSSPNLPIAEATITLVELEQTRAELGREGEDRYRKLLIQELNYELNVKNQ